MRVPGRAALARLRDPRPGELDQRQHRGTGERERDRGLGHQQRDPARLGDEDRLDVGHAGGAPRRILPRGAPPLEDHRHAHHHVAGDHHRVVDRVALVDGLEHVGQAERQDDHADHLEHRQQPVDPVVGVVGRGEPGEVDPRPGDRERAQREAEQPGLDVVLGDVVRELVGGDAERDDEREVEQQLERRRRAVRLGWGRARPSGPCGASAARSCARHPRICSTGPAAAATNLSKRSASDLAAGVGSDRHGRSDRRRPRTGRTSPDPPAGARRPHRPGVDPQPRARRRHRGRRRRRRSSATSSRSRRPRTSTAPTRSSSPPAPGPGSGAERKRTVDLGAALACITAAVVAGVPRFVIVSSIGAHDPDAGPEAMRPYLRAKAEADAGRRDERARLDDRAPRQPHRRSRHRPASRPPRTSAAAARCRATTSRSSCSRRCRRPRRSGAPSWSWPAIRRRATPSGISVHPATSDRS